MVGTGEEDPEPRRWLRVELIDRSCLSLSLCRAREASLDRRWYPDKLVPSWSVSASGSGLKLLVSKAV